MFLYLAGTGAVVAPLLPLPKPPSNKKLKPEKPKVDPIDSLYKQIKLISKTLNTIYEDIDSEENTSDN